MNLSNNRVVRSVAAAFFGGTLIVSSPSATGATKQRVDPDHRKLELSQNPIRVLQPSFDLSDPTVSPFAAAQSLEVTGHLPSEEKASGTVFGVSGPIFQHVEQGMLGNCYVASSFAAVAAVRPELVREMLQTGDDGHYRVRLWKKQEETEGQGRWVPEVYGPVDAEFPTIPDAPEFPRRWLYGASSQALPEEARASWWPLIEKAIASGREQEANLWDVYVEGDRGSYATLSGGGDSSTILGMILGADGFRLSTGKPGPAFQSIKEQLDARLPVTAHTIDESPEERLRHLGVGMPDGVPDVWKQFVPKAKLSAKLWKKYGITENHVYAVVGYRLKEGRPMIKVYNPSWEQHVQAAKRRGGVLELSADEFAVIFNGIYSVSPPQPRTVSQGE